MPAGQRVGGGEDGPAIRPPHTPPRSRLEFVDSGVGCTRGPEGKAEVMGRQTAGVEEPGA